MSVKDKYQSVLNLGEELNIKNGDVSEENGVLKVKGQAKTPYEKNLMWDKIKEVGGENPSDIKANITVPMSRFMRGIPSKAENHSVKLLSIIMVTR